jgi:diguanylate cyclase (GGDEF)-like protein
MPRWQLVVSAVAGAACVSLALAVADIVVSGVDRPATAALGVLAAALVNRVYPVVARRGQVVEGIDIAEAAIVALALLLPPGEAILCFVLASVVIEIPADRARAKKVFNVSVRAVGAGLLVLPMFAVGTPLTPTGAQFVAVTVGAVVYSVFNTLAVGSVIAAVDGERLLSVVRVDFVPRTIVWCLAVAVGLFSGYAASRAPAALAAVLALLVLVWLTASAARRAQAEGANLRYLLDAATRIQAAEGQDEQDAVLLEVTHELLLWKDVAIRDSAPQAAERGALLYCDEGEQRWLIATPREGSDPWTVADARILDTLAAAATAASERALMREELSRQALLDPLTGVANRRCFDDEVERLEAERVGYGILLCDLDHFKTVNDRLGHDAGDEVLRIAAARLTAGVRSTDMVARLGGDEFVVLLPGLTSRKGLAAARQQIAAKLAEPLQVGRWQLPCLPCSLGVASSPRDGRSGREVLRAADESMYDVKRRHRTAPVPVTVRLPEPRSGESTVILID